MKPELHLFIIWENATLYLHPIIEDIKTKFTIKQAFRVHWSSANYSANLSRFYGKRLPPGCNKEVHCGTGPFTLLVVQDNRPLYAKRLTSEGECAVNINTFDAKSLYRHWTGGGHRIHATNTLQECAHDLILLLGCTPDTFQAQYPGNWDGTIRTLHQDLIGTNGWQSIQQLFTVLNNTVNYVVLRNFECLPNEYTMDQHGDIDLLTDDVVSLALVTNGDKVFRQEYRVHYKVMISGEPVYFDFRYAGDGYYDERWERLILRTRELSDKGFFTPSKKQYFYSLLYHALIHKSDIAPDYVDKLLALAGELHLDGISYKTLTDNRKLKAFLDAYMNEREYRYTGPADRSVYFHLNLF